MPVSSAKRSDSLRYESFSQSRSSPIEHTTAGIYDVGFHALERFVRILPADGLDDPLMLGLNRGELRQRAAQT